MSNFRPKNFMSVRKKFPRFLLKRHCRGRRRRTRNRRVIVPPPEKPLSDARNGAIRRDIAARCPERRIPAGIAETTPDTQERPFSDRAESLGREIRPRVPPFPPRTGCRYAEKSGHAEIIPNIRVRIACFRSSRHLCFARARQSVRNAATAEFRNDRYNPKRLCTHATTSNGAS